MPLLSCNQLTVAYDKKIAVDHVSFQIEAADYICIVGKNGSGKSSLIKSILGLVPIQSGQIQFLEGLKANEIGYLPQQTNAQQNFPASVFEIVLSGFLSKQGWRPFFSKKDKQVALDNMNKLEILHLKNTPYIELSGGQQQRVLMARALCATDKLLILDEPVTGLDPVMMQTFYHLLQELNRTEKITILMISHDVKTAVQFANKILHLDKSIQFFGPTEDYTQSPIGKKFLEGEII